MQSITLFLEGTPIAKQSFRMTKSGMKYQTKEIKNSALSIGLQAKNQLQTKYPKFKMYQNKVIIDRLEFRFPPLKSMNKAELIKIQLSDELTITNEYLPKTSKPDLDNLEKNLFDALKGIVMLDDNLVYRKNNVIKRYSNNPGIYIVLLGE